MLAPSTLLTMLARKNGLRVAPRRFAVGLKAESLISAARDGLLGADRLRGMIQTSNLSKEYLEGKKGKGLSGWQSEPLGSPQRGESGKIRGGVWP